MNNRCAINKQNELANCTFIKTVLMLLVVLYHSVVYWAGGWFVGSPVYAAPLLAGLSGWLNSVHISGFSLVSGYIFYYQKYENGKYGEFKPFVINKAKRLLIPYVFVALIWVIPISLPFFSWDAKTLFSKFVLGTAPSQLWFLLMLFLVFVLFWPLSNAFKKYDAAGACAMVLIYGIGLVGKAIFPNVFQIFRACSYMPLFWLGFKIRQKGSYWLRKIPVLAWLLAQTGMFALTLFFQKNDGIFWKLMYLGSDFLLNIAGALLAFIILQRFSDVLEWKRNKIFAYLSKCAMAIYLLHQQIIYVMIDLLNGLINPYLNGLINFAVAMIISLLVSSFFMRFKVTRTLIGEK